MKILEEGAVAVVTGAAGGIGREIVATLAAEGVRIAGWDRVGADFTAMAAACERAGVAWTATEVDVRDRDATLAAARAATELGTVRYGVNAAGVDNLQPTATMPTRDWRDVFAVNVDGVLFSCLAQLDVIGHHGGSIVNIASISGMIVNRDCAPHAAYSASKAAVIHLSRTLAVEWAPHGVRVNSVSPGYTRTEMTDSNPDELNVAFRRQSPLGRMAEPSEIAAPVAFLLGSGGGFITGANLPVDGGVTVW
ncbi:MAG: SDR family NAD(P)-dependent oxidoreductase [Propionibacteriaceae bacterium]